MICWQGPAETHGKRDPDKVDVGTLLQHTPVNGPAHNPEFLSAGLAHPKQQGEVTPETQAVKNILHVAVPEDDL